MKLKTKTVKKTLNKRIYLTFRNDYFIRNKKIGIAVSGGVDSMVLLDLFCKARKNNSLELFVLHYNHKWRKKSILDANLVRDYCKKSNIHFVYGETKGKIIKDEEIAREHRYLFFIECFKKYDLDTICTAHHFDDQVETILFRLCRGTGPRGLLPIKEHLKLSCETIFYRPLLPFTKEEVYLIAKRNNVPYREDISNSDLKYKRNFIRKKIVPLLFKINKNSTKNILDFSNLVQAQNNTLDTYFSELLKKISTINCFEWNRTKFLRLDEYSRKAFIYWFLSTYNFKGNIEKLDIYLDAILNKKRFDINKDYFFCVSEKHICFLKKRMKEVHGTLSNEQSLLIKPYNKERIVKKFPPDRKKIAYVDLSRYKLKNLSIRYRRIHDVFHPLGFSSAVKLKKYLINKKVPQNERYSLPLLCSRNEVLWIPGYSLSEKIKVISKPTHVLELKGFVGLPDKSDPMKMIDRKKVQLV